MLPAGCSEAQPLAKLDARAVRLARPPRRTRPGKPGKPAVPAVEKPPKQSAAAGNLRRKLRVNSTASAYEQPGAGGGGAGRVLKSPGGTEVGEKGRTVSIV